MLKDKTLNFKSIEEVRSEIDRIDKEIIKLLGERFQFVKEVAKFKMPDKVSIRAKERYENVIEERGKWAVENGLDPTTIKLVYRQLLDYFIEEQMRILNCK
jgi:isochorismate pyruvate lyase